MELNTNESSAQFIELATDIVSAYVSNNSVGAGELPVLIKDVYGALTNVTNPEAHSQATNAKPAVSIKKSITPDYIICLEDGKKFKSLKRHLRTQYGLCPSNTARSGASLPTTPWSRRTTPPPARALRSKWASGRRAPSVAAKNVPRGAGLAPQTYLIFRKIG